MRHSRILVQDIPYHVFARGNNRQTLFHGDEDRLFYLGMLDKAHKKFDFTVFSYVLMSNHFHLLLQMLRTSTLSALMHWLQLGYARYYGQKYKHVGHVFQSRYFSPVVERDNYFLTVDRYIHLNPVKKHLCDDPAEYRYSSAYPGWKLDPVPQGLKPTSMVTHVGTAEAVPFQSQNTSVLSSSEFFHRR